MDSIIRGSKPIIKAFTNPAVIMVIKNSLIFVGVSKTVDNLTGSMLPSVLLTIPFILWNIGELDKYST